MVTVITDLHQFIAIHRDLIRWRIVSDVKSWVDIVNAYEQLLLQDIEQLVVVCDVLNS